VIEEVEDEYFNVVLYPDLFLFISGHCGRPGTIVDQLEHDVEGACTSAQEEKREERMTLTFEKLNALFWDIFAFLALRLFSTDCV
jgi:hypothetical protein